MIQVFEKMHARRAGALVIISHQERLLSIADKIIVIADGTIRKIGKKDEVLDELLGMEKEPCGYYQEV